MLKAAAAILAESQRPQLPRPYTDTGHRGAYCHILLFGPANSNTPR